MKGPVLTPDNDVVYAFAIPYYTSTNHKHILYVNSKICFTPVMMPNGEVKYFKSNNIEDVINELELYYDIMEMDNGFKNPFKDA